MRRRPLLSLALTGAVVLGGPQATLGQVRDQGGHRCSVVGRLVDFGVYDPLAGAPNDAAGEIILRCDCTGNGCGALHLRLELIEDGDGRFMHPTGSGGTTLRYELYSDAARSTPWGQGDDALSGPYQPPHNGDRQTLPVYGRIPPMQSAGPGNYTDEVLVVVTY